MKKILITGAGSYIGTSFETYIKENFPNDYIVDTLDMLDGSWSNYSFVGYDCVFHVAGIAHQKETKKNAHLYQTVNCDLAIEVAKKAKSEGVGQFIFLSSMSVYGMDTGVITKSTQPNPKTHYGKSKWNAEQGIAHLADQNFHICIVRPPMVYGKGCKGNFNSICKLVAKSPIFPRIKNKRSMIFIENLCAFIHLCVEKNLSGVYFPQNEEYVSTVDMARGVAFAMKRKIHFEYFTGFAVSVLRLFCPIAKKAFGSLIYQDTEDFDFSYIVTKNQESFIKSI